MKRSTTLRTALGLALGLAALAGSPQRVAAIGDPNLFPDLIGRALGSYQSYGDRNQRGTVQLDITAQFQGRFVGAIIIGPNDRTYLVQGTVAPSGEATLVGFEDGHVFNQRPPGLQFVIYGVIAIIDDALVFRGSYQFVGPGGDQGSIVIDW